MKPNKRRKQKQKQDEDKEQRPLSERITEEDFKHLYPFPTWSCCVYYNHDGENLEGLYHGKNSAAACLRAQITSWTMTEEYIEEMVSEIRRIQERYGIKRFGHVATYQGFNDANCVVTCLVCGRSLMEQLGCIVMSPSLRESSVGGAMMVFLCKEHLRDKSEENIREISRRVKKIEHDADQYWPPVEGRETV